MSDKAHSDDLVRDLTSAIRNLSIAANHLSSHVGASSPGPAPLVDPEWEVVEEECSPYPTLASKLSRDSSCRGVEEGPLPTPAACFDLARRRLTSTSVGVDARVDRAFRAGFWAWAAIETHTPYSAESDLPGLKICHWVVLTSGRNPPAFRVASRRDFAALTAGDPHVVAEKFASLTEVQIFCLGAKAPVPQLLECKRQM